MTSAYFRFSEFVLAKINFLSDITFPVLLWKVIYYVIGFVISFSIPRNKIFHTKPECHTLSKTCVAFIYVLHT